MVHPSLSEHLHNDECNNVIQQLHQCHSTHSVAKFWGACNDLKNALDDCLGREFEVRRLRNLEEARERNRRVDEARALLLPMSKSDREDLTRRQTERRQNWERTHAEGAPQ
ncbi:hypothetical protein CAOG_02893 [Capsaspora owczarzaki ATCC 30864]|uniref:COX assembly mitochondrial protein n=1 Tax=Capsaspora owczarzaki (strain ATCC 30864) TaxID=595528 RepID=A0A0D2WM28_CAPO3|nr:hypothetical protein CAOG_02893 [Capsaspora owczarzaki ATCC 30864]KJE91810.1 hypothetical protein CAOG_002893 [Capsaspora owczarzaki ATCC 30864]|eukprot:XP_004363732.1 hypothetical protein CAOG_02893 [Capsaspora owczarzaki ATCC 30864]